MGETEGRKRRLERWALQSAARELLSGERVSWCMRRVAFGHRDVQVWHSPAVMRAHYKHLAICGSVWHCPICGAKITERRRVDLSNAITRHPELHPVLVTFTLSHTRQDKLKDVLGVLTDSYRKVRSGKGWELFERGFQIVGGVRALEVTHGANGWHPHLHVLLFCRVRPDADAIKQTLWARWHHALERNHSTAMFEHGVDVQIAFGDVADYVSKFGHEPLKDSKRWGLEHELTKSPTKLARGDRGRTPLQLLADYAGGDKQAGAIWKEYAVTFKGQRQLVWSKRLRAMLKLGQEKSDDEIAKETREDAVLLARLTLGMWRVVLGNDARGELLEIAHAGDAGKVFEFLQSIGAGDRVEFERLAAAMS